MWGAFLSVTQPQQREYVRAYWRYLLRWGPPPTAAVTTDQAKALRTLARAEVKAYRRSAAKGAHIFYPFPPPRPPSPSPAPASARRTA
jgi:hypothetical protein